MGKARPSETLQIYPHQTLTGVKKEHHARQGKLFICEDKMRDYLIASQRLTDIVDQINAIVREKPCRVSLAGLYQSLGKTDDRTMGWVKFRWKVRPYDLESAAEQFQARLGRGFEHALIVGSREAYEICT